MTTKDAQQRTHEVVQVAIDELRPDPANPRRISDAQLEALTKGIREYGLFQPILARREDKTVIGGHQRITAARRLGSSSRRAASAICGCWKHRFAKPSATGSRASRSMWFGPKLTRKMKHASPCRSRIACGRRTRG